MENRPTNGVFAGSYTDYILWYVERLVLASRSPGCRRCIPVECRDRNVSLAPLQHESAKASVICIETIILFYFFYGFGLYVNDDNPLRFSTHNFCNLFFSFAESSFVLWLHCDSTGIDYCMKRSSVSRVPLCFLCSFAELSQTFHPFLFIETAEKKVSLQRMCLGIVLLYYFSSVYPIGTLLIGFCGFSLFADGLHAVSEQNQFSSYFFSLIDKQEWNHILGDFTEMKSCIF